MKQKTAVDLCNLTINTHTTSYELAKKHFEYKLQHGENSTISIRDPITQHILEKPGRGFCCDHLECFEVANFYKIMEINKEL